MSDFERQKYERRLIVLETDVIPIDLEIQGYRDSLRDLLDPIRPTSELPWKTIADLAIKGASRNIDQTAKLNEILRLKELLGK